jgi:hypothetical protein
MRHVSSIRRTNVNITAHVGLNYSRFIFPACLKVRATTEFTNYTVLCMAKEKDFTYEFRRVLIRSCLIYKIYCPVI